MFFQLTPDPDRTREIADSLMAVNAQLKQKLMTDPEGFFHQLGGDFIRFGLKVVAAIAIYVVGIWVIRLIKNAINRSFTRRQTDHTVVTFINSLISVLGNVILIIIVISTLGVNTTSLAALLAAMGMAVGMSLSGTLQNFAGGIILLIFKPFKVGDYIETQGYEGTVTAVNIMTTKIRTVNNQEINLPNGSLSSTNIKNYSTYPYRRCDWDVSVEYGIDSSAFIEKVQALLHENQQVIYLDQLKNPVKMPQSASRITLPAEHVLADPVVYLKSLNASDITFTIRVWTKTEDYWSVYFAMQKRFYDELPKSGFSFAYPHLDVNMLTEAEGEAQN